MTALPFYPEDIDQWSEQALVLILYRLQTFTNQYYNKYLAYSNPRRRILIIKSVWKKQLEAPKQKVALYGGKD